MNAANLITLARMVLIVPIGAAMLAKLPTAALLLFLIAAATDYADGVLARRQGPTALGAMLDPLADKALTTAILMLLAAQGVLQGVHILAAIAIVLREFAVAGARETLAARGEKMPVTQLAKWKTAAQFFALAFLIVAPMSPTIANAGYVALWIAAGLTVWTGGQYMTQAMRVLKG